MLKRSVFMMVCATIAVTFYLAAGESSAQSRSRGGAAFKPVMSLHGLMIEQDRHFENILSILRDASGKDREKRLNHEAMALAEMANINGFHEEAVKYQDYREWAAQLQSQAAELGELGLAGKFKEAKKAARAMNATCTACHDKHDS